ncbi:hypothetical protein GIB67_008098 [Kingdonia uniflora]|uniref:Uncharacterized protein n=1 Tax=Kingdonia uniflora TaxID=39325 RepID=A0A7J7MCQ8_9MAGN|nr:hypothetical protein GIB67_008098 [Kingdonia uniflora]
MYGMETMSFEEVISTLLSEERRLKGSESLGENSVMVVSGKRSFNRSDCKARKGNGASLARGFESDTNKLEMATSNDGDEAFLVVRADGSRHNRGWVFDSGATMHVCTYMAWFSKLVLGVHVNRIKLPCSDLTPPRFPNNWYQSEVWGKLSSMMGISNCSNTIKLDVGKFDGKINFGLRKMQVQDILTYGGLCKVLKESAIPKTLIEGIVAQRADDDEEEDWDDLDSRVVNGIRLCLAKNDLENLAGEKSAKGPWEKLKSLYQTKCLSNRLYLKEQLHALKMNEGTSVGDLLGSLNGIISELESIGVKVKDEDKALQLIWSLSSSFKHLQPTLMYGKETLSFEEVTSMLLFEEIRLKGCECLRENFTMVVSGKIRFNRFRKGTC